MQRDTAQTAASAGANEIRASPGLPMSYDVKINSLRTGGSTKGNATVTINGQFAICRVNIRDGPHGLFVSMPRWRGADNEYHDICFPCTKESHAEFGKAVLEAFEQARIKGVCGQEQALTETLPLHYNVRILSLRTGNGTVKGTASVSLNNQFAISKVSIMEGSRRLFVSTPGFRGGNGMFRDYCYPCTKESRAEFNKAVIDAYKQALSQKQSASESQAHNQQAEAHTPFEYGAHLNAPAMQM